MQAKDALERAISGAGDDLIRLSHVIHERPETAFEEHYAAGRVAEELAKHGFEIEEGVGGLPTAIRATFGQGSAHVSCSAPNTTLYRISAMPAVTMLSQHHRRVLP